MKYWLLTIVILLGMFLRIYQPLERFIYGHDSDLASWMVRDILVDHHFRLIGQQTSEQGIFIGPYFYYSLIPFYLLGHMDPAYSVGLSWLIGLLAMSSLYFVVSKVHGHKPALISTLIYAISFAIVYTEREVVPTTPVMLWTIWAYYAIIKQKPYLIAILLALVWHINLALILLSPIFVVSIIKKLNLRTILISSTIFIVLSLPLLVFESRHSFIQTKALIGTLTSIETKSSHNLLHTLTYAAKNLNKIFYFDFQWSMFTLPVILLLGSLWLTIIKKVPKYFFWLVISWQALFITFFTLHPINLSEYYLNGMNIIWIIIAGLLLSEIPIILNALFIIPFIYLNLNSFFSQNINKVGYNYKKSLVEYIKQDSLKHGYPCVSVSYMTNPGYDLGYRYFFYLANLHVNQPKSNSPVYTIVFPHSRANRIDKSFGALGLINPDYSKYDAKTVKISCSGENSNLTDPMFGYTN